MYPPFFLQKGFEIMSGQGSGVFKKLSIYEHAQVMKSMDRNDKRRHLGCKLYVISYLWVLCKMKINYVLQT